MYMPARVHGEPVAQLGCFVQAGGSLSMVKVHSELAVPPSCKCFDRLEEVAPSTPNFHSDPAMRGSQQGPASELC